MLLVAYAIAFSLGVPKPVVKILAPDTQDQPQKIAPQIDAIPFSNGKVIAVRGNARTPARVDPIELAVIRNQLDTSGWQSVKAGENGTFTGPTFNSGYAHFVVQSDRSKPMLLEAKGHSMVYVNGEPRVGDVYSWGYVSLPIELKEGANTFLFATVRGSFSGKLVPPTAPVSLDLRDATLPDLIDGQRGKLLGAIVVKNATESRAGDIELVVNGSAIVVPHMLPWSVRKVGFAFNPPKDGILKLQVRQKGKLVGSDRISLRRRALGQTYKITFRSAIDDSIQYYAVTPSTKPAPNQALFLSLHGASVEAISQADSYGPKSWGTLVAPTNRRPYGFNWEDIGRLDALEVLDLATERFSVDPSQIYLTGHSMGGHGAWHLGTLFPDKFAAIAPCAGWISYFSYANGATYPKTPVGDTLARAMGASDTLAMKSNLMSKPIFVQHGDADDTVPVSEARNMRKELEGHRFLDWHEEKGQSHWFDTDPEPGANVQDYDGIFELFAKTRLPELSQVRLISFATPNLSISNKSFWLTIVRQSTPGQLSTAKAKIFPGLRRLEIETTNVDSFDIDCAPFRGSGPVTILWNGTESKHDVPANTAKLSVGKFASDADSKLLGFKSVFAQRVLFVVGTHADALTKQLLVVKARYDAESLWYIGNGSVDVITDDEFMTTPKKYAGRNLVCYGNKTSNTVIATLVPGLPRYPTVDDALLTASFIEDRGIIVATIGGGGSELGQRLTERIPLFTAGAAIPDQYGIRPESLVNGLEGVWLCRFNGDR